MKDFWQTIRGKELADALIHALPILAGEAWKKQQQKQFVVCVNHNESIAYLSHNPDGNYTATLQNVVECITTNGGTVQQIVPCNGPGKNQYFILYTAAEKIM